MRLAICCLALLMAGCMHQGVVPVVDKHRIVFRAYCLDEDRPITDWSLNWHRVFAAGTYHYNGLPGNNRGTWHRWQFEWREVSAAEYEQVKDADKTQWGD